MKMLNAFKYAWVGVLYCLTNELNFRIHLSVMLIIILSGAYFSISKLEWIAVITCCIFVLTIEMINTAIENMCDKISPDFHPIIKNIKDISAGAVLVSAIGSSIIGCMIFIPKIFN